MNENLHIAHTNLAHKNLACSQRQIHTAHTCKLSQAKFYRRTLIPITYKQPLSTHPFLKVQLYIVEIYIELFTDPNCGICLYKETVDGVTVPQQSSNTMAAFTSHILKQLASLHQHQWPSFLPALTVIFQL